MKINEKFHIEEPYKGAATAGAICTNLLGVERTYVPGEPAYNFLKTVLNICRKRLYSSETKNYKLIELFEKTPMSNEEIAERLFSVPGVEFKIRESYRGEAKTEAEAPAAAVETLTPAEKKAVLKKILNFFSEFRFSPSIRFVNTLIRTADKQFRTIPTLLRSPIRSSLRNLRILKIHLISGPTKSRLSTIALRSTSVPPVQVRQQRPSLKPQSVWSARPICSRSTLCRTSHLLKETPSFRSPICGRLWKPAKRSCLTKLVCSRSSL